MAKKKDSVQEEAKEEAQTQAEEPQDEVAQESVAEPEDTIESLQAALEEECERTKELTERWKRSAAEFSNYRKRMEKERSELVKFSNALLITRLLPILDDLQRAFQTLPMKLRQFTWVDGIALVERKLAAILEQEGLVCIEAHGEAFDPALHQAIVYEETAEGEDGIVLEELQRGYKLGDRVIRPTLVKVAKKVEATAQEEEPEQPEQQGEADQEQQE
jgi:molecular chaperone GrpE